MVVLQPISYFRKLHIVMERFTQHVALSYTVSSDTSATSCSDLSPSLADCGVGSLSCCVGWGGFVVCCCGGGGGSGTCNLGSILLWPNPPVLISYFSLFSILSIVHPLNVGTCLGTVLLYITIVSR